MKRVYDKESLPILARALEADPFTHSLAVEQISAITQKYFTHFKIQHSYRGQQKMTTRVLWWLKARGYLPR